MSYAYVPSLQILETIRTQNDPGIGRHRLRVTVSISPWQIWREIGIYMGIGPVFWEDPPSTLDYCVFLKFEDGDIYAFHPFNTFPVIEEYRPSLEDIPIAFHYEQGRLF